MTLLLIDSLVGSSFECFGAAVALAVGLGLTLFVGCACGLADGTALAVAAMARIPLTVSAATARATVVRIGTDTRVARMNLLLPGLRDPSAARRSVVRGTGCRARSRRRAVSCSCPAESWWLWACPAGGGRRAPASRTGPPAVRAHWRTDWPGRDAGSW